MLEKVGCLYFIRIGSWYECVPKSGTCQYFRVPNSTSFSADPGSALSKFRSVLVGDMGLASTLFLIGENEMPFDVAKLAIARTLFNAAFLLGNDLIILVTSLFARSVAFVDGLVRRHESSCYMMQRG